MICTPRSRYGRPFALAALLALPAPAQVPGFSSPQLTVPPAATDYGRATTADIDGDGLLDVAMVGHQDSASVLWASFGTTRYGGALPLGDAVDCAVLHNRSGGASALFSVSSTGQVEQWAFQAGTVVAAPVNGPWTAGSAVEVATWSCAASPIGYLVVRDTADRLHPLLYFHDGAYYLGSLPSLNLGPALAWVLSDVDGDSMPTAVVHGPGLIIAAELTGTDPWMVTSSLAEPRGRTLRHTAQAAEQVVWTSWDGSTARLHAMIGSTVLAAIDLGQQEVVGLTSGHLDGDGYADVAVAFEDAVMALVYAPVPPATQPFTQPAATLPICATESSWPCIADYDGDGDSDLCVAYASGGMATSLVAVHPGAAEKEAGFVPTVQDVVSGLIGDLYLFIQPPAEPGLEFDALQIVCWDGTDLNLDLAELAGPAALNWIIDVDDTSWPSDTAMTVALPSWDSTLGDGSLFFLEVRLLRFEPSGAVHTLPTAFYAGFNVPGDDESDPDWQLLINHPDTSPVTRGKLTPGVVITSGRPRPQVPPVVTDPISVPNPFL